MKIASRDEVLKVRKDPSYSPDLSYLKTAPKDSLAVRLAKPHKNDASTPRQKVSVLREKVAALTEKRRAERLAREQIPPMIEPSNIDTYIRKRTEVQLDRSAPGQGIPYALSTKKIKSNIFFKVHKTIRTALKNAKELNSLRPMLDSPGPFPLAKSAKPIAERPDEELSPSALKRRQQRRLRESMPKRLRQSLRQNKEESTMFGNDLNSFDSADLERASPAVQEPAFDGPEPIPEIIGNNFGFVQHHPFAKGHSNPNLVGSLAGDDYSGYTSLSSSISNSMSPTTALAIVNTAELALSCQHDYSIPQRKQAIEIVKAFAKA